ncbi:UNVERIFIED_CONTAM: hypothetical protein Sradi_2123400 [Sesamum radiatum]|uniref:Uncharacterized protein n=1 Tax=Sesamum radiatum TaxID=300843 RepID=A0AAW2TJB4_SESRA
MALELEEEKKAQAEREKRLQEQAKKIENLSSMVFCANREETSVIYKKVCLLSSAVLFATCMLLANMSEVILHAVGSFGNIV